MRNNDASASLVNNEVMAAAVALDVVTFVRKQNLELKRRDNGDQSYVVYFTGTKGDDASIWRTKIFFNDGGPGIEGRFFT
jgi:hypothetical protein